MIDEELWKQAERLVFLDASAEDIEATKHECMCGDYMETHDSGMNVGHSPVDQYSYYVGSAYQYLIDKRDNEIALFDCLPKF